MFQSLHAPEGIRVEYSAIEAGLLGGDEQYHDHPAAQRVVADVIILSALEQMASTAFD